MLNENNLVRRAHQTINLRDAALARQTRRGEHAVLHIHDHHYPGSEGFALLPELEQPAGALYVTKTACDAFYHTSLAQVLDEHDIQQFVICGCATDYCLDTTITYPRLAPFLMVVSRQ